MAGQAGLQSVSKVLLQAQGQVQGHLHAKKPHFIFDHLQQHVLADWRRND